MSLLSKYNIIQPSITIINSQNKNNLKKDSLYTITNTNGQQVNLNLKNNSKLKLKLLKSKLYKKNGHKYSFT